jgi:hypothetical protein
MDVAAEADMNPCAEGGSGELSGMESQPPTDDATAVTITASEYRFAGTDVLKAGGRFAITFESAGTELHELHIAKLPEGDERPLDEILHDPEAESTTTSVGHAFACPGTASTPSGADLSASGRYVVVCFIPTGATPATDPKDFETLGPPHALQGMGVELTVGS